MPKRAQNDSSRASVAVRLTEDELLNLDAFVDRMRQQFPEATRSSVIRTMIRRYLSSSGKQP